MAWGLSRFAGHDSQALGPHRMRVHPDPGGAQVPGDTYTAKCLLHVYNAEAAGSRPWCLAFSDAALACR